MSADNYWLVRKHEGQFVVSMEFASSDEPSDVAAARLRFNSLEDVEKFLQEDDDYTEYGTIYNFPHKVVEVEQ